VVMRMGGRRVGYYGSFKLVVYTPARFDPQMQQIPSLSSGQAGVSAELL